jgi:Ser/Thr protein kinase RdoA (MazF antagonist)
LVAAAVAGVGAEVAAGHLVHGLSRELAAPDWPPLTIAELSAVLAAYEGLGAVEAITWHSPRPLAASALVACAAGGFFVKRHHRAVRDAADLAEEHAFLAHLRHSGASVPAVLASRDGLTAIAAGDATYEVHSIVAGDDLYRDAVSWSPFTSTAHARAAGRALAELHRAAGGFCAPPRATGLLVADFRVFGAADPMAALRRRVAAEPLLAGALANRAWRSDIADTLLPWHARLAPHLPALTALWTHNDFHASNLLWRGDGGVAGVIDFGLANVTSAAFDLATAIERNAVEWLRLADGTTDIAHAELAAALIAGYREISPLPPGQAAALPHLLPLVHAEFALSELAYFHGVLGSGAKAGLAYHDFLLGHARWFATRHGRNFLHSVGDVE